ncbi:MAG TPA: IS481 family transposase, partial [Solirubrobacteraceae bacterium]|nr:IS481 family transposase [Solirubrobacteraceae bacterium]
MGQHLRGKLGPAGRVELAHLQVDLGWSERAAAAALSVSSRTARRWKQRRLSATAAEIASGAWALDRSSRPHHSPARTAADMERRVCAERERSGHGPRLIAGRVGVAHSTVHAILRRHGLSRIPKAPREAVVRFEWPCPGDLLQMDTKRFGRFTRPGHRVTGDRHRTGAEKRARVGWEFCHSIIDDHSRIAYSELHADQKADTVVAFTQRALDFYAALGIQPRRLQTDNAWIYTHNNALKAQLATRGIRHRTIPPRTPKRNGKIERYQQTLAREWAYGQRYRSSDARAAALPHWLAHYNTARPHSEIGNRPPISRAP